MGLACLLAMVGALACAAEQRGFVNRRLPVPDFLESGTSAPAKPLPAANPEKKCIHIDAIERIVPPEVDKSMVIPTPKDAKIDSGILVPTAPFCRDLVPQGRPKN